MITGTVLYDIEVKVANEEALNELGVAVRAALKTVSGVISSGEVDSDLEDDADNEPEVDQD